MRPAVHIRLEPRASSRDCTEYSDIFFSCEKKHEPAFKPLQGNPTFFQVGNLGIHCTTGSKFRVPLTYRLLRKGAS